jgi:hypothetical protein
MNGTETVFLALGPAVVTGILGYAVARLQARVALAQAAAENGRLRLQYAETRRDHRQRSYHDFLSLMYRLDSMIGGLSVLSEEDFARWIGDFQRVYGGIELFGASPVRDRLPAVRDAVNAIGEAATYRDVESFESAMRDAYRDGRGRLISAVDELIESMRTDVTG